MKKNIKNITYNTLIEEFLSTIIKLKKLVKARMIFFIFIQLYFSIGLYSQDGACDGTVPVFNVDLSSNASGVWVMPNVVRDGSCCSYSHPPLSCVKFIVTLNSNARSIIFNVTDGALPSNLEWQLMNSDGDYCDPTKYPANVPVCMSGVGPHTIVFCKPGGNNNTYSITSVPSSALKIDSLFNGCEYTLDAGADWSTIIWNTGDTTQLITARDSGWYWVETSNINCTTKRDSIYYAYVPPLTLGNDTSICYGDSVVLDIGTGYSYYKWSNGIEGALKNAITVSGGAYSVTVTDHLGCTTTSTKKIIEGTKMQVDISKTDVICFGESNGKINLSASGGFTPYIFTWNSGQTTEDIANIPQGNYFVTVTDNIGCQVDTNISLVAPLAPISASIDISDVSCFNGSNGAIDITVSGDIPPYTYVWNNGEISEDISGLVSGVYIITITGANNCTAVFTDTVYSPSNNLSAFILGEDVKCKGASDGKTSTTVSGGTPPYTFLWNNGETSQDISNLFAGNYSLTVTDAQFCNTTASIVIEDPKVDLLLTASTIKPSCKGYYDGAIDLNVSGGTPGYNFFWSTNEISEDLLGVASDEYFVTVTDVNDCTVQTSIILDEPNSIELQSIVNEIDCFGNLNGDIDVLISGGTIDYTYFWNNGITTEDLIDVPAGEYYLTVTDANNCIKKTSVNISSPSELSSQIYATNVSCKGGSDGAINLTPIGGTAPYTYAWSNLSVLEDLTGLVIGTYSVTITDDNGCTTTNSVTVSEPANVLTVNLIGTNLLCNGISSGKTQITVSGGTPNYTYLWSNGLTNSDLTDLSAGAYTVTVTDAKSCSQTASVTLTEPSAIVATPTVNSSTCGNANGSVSVAVSGGNAPYSYLWSNGVTINSLSNIKAGPYSLTITDNNLCTKIVNTNVNDIAAPTITTQSKSNVTCYGALNGSVSVLASGGTSPYTYQWSNGGNTSSISAVSGGVYTVKVVDNAGCISSKSIEILEPEEIKSILIVKNVNCNGGNDGSINLLVSGGTSPYTYSWNNGATTKNLTNITSGNYIVNILDSLNCPASNNVTVTQPPIALSINNTIISNVVCKGEENGSIILSILGGTQPYGYQWSSGQQWRDIDNLKAGTYSVTVTDANYCTVNKSITVDEPQLLTASIVGTDVLCKGGATGTATLTVTGGTPSYTYTWNYGQVTQNLTNVSAGYYEVLVRDTKSCNTTASITISEPSEALSATITKTNVKCSGQTNGSANLEVRGGTPPYTYLWSNGAITQDLSNIAAGTYTVTVKDFNNCTVTSSVSISSPTLISVSGSSNAVSCKGGNDGEALLTVSGGTSPYSYKWNLGQTSEDLTNLQAGTYMVTISDAKLCTQTHSVTVTEPLAITLSTVITEVSCLNGTNGAINLSVSGGTGAYSYKWNTGLITQDLSGLSAGIYEVTVTDANSCSTSSANTVAQPSSAVTVGLTPYNLKCRVGADGEINATVSGGTPPYTYLWSNGATTEDLTGLSIGTFTLTATDANSCTSSSSATLTQPLTLLTLSTVGTDILCNGASTGEIDLTVSNGTAPYTYLWSNGTLSEDVTTIPAGNYSVTVTDANFCVKSTSTTLTEPSAVNITSTSTNSTCLIANGSATLTVTGGTSPYTYLWSTGSTVNNITNQASGAYSVTVTDANACAKEYSVDINDATGPNVQISYKSDVTCNGDADGKATVYVNYGLNQADYDILWSGGSTSTIQSGLSGGYQTVRVTDHNTNCVTSISVYIDEPDELVVTNYTPNVCDAGELGFIDLSVTGGIKNYRYIWSNGQTSQDLINVPAGNYIVTVSDVNLCQKVQSIDITVPAVTLSTSIVGTNVKCKNGSDGKANLTVVGGITPYSYLWNFGQITEDINNIPAGFYEVTVTDAIGCKSISSVTITEPTILNKSTVRTNVTCNGLANGSIDLTVTGGTLPYSFNWSNGKITEDNLNIIAGSYNVTITDANSCVTTTSATVSEPTALAATILGTNVKCNGDNSGSVSVVASGGTPIYTYLWSNASTSSSQANVVAGTYDVTVTDANSCTITKSLTITQPDALTTSITASNVNCYGGSDGLITLTTSGGIPPDYTYIWNYGQTSNILTSVKAGKYQVTVTDVNLCSKSDSVIITQPASALTASFAITNVSCNSGNDGAIDLTVSGGTPIYSYNWSNGFSVQDINSLTAATYDVTVTDSKGCRTTNSVVVSQPNAITINDLSTNVSCNAGADGTISLSVLGGTPSYSYLWSNAKTTQNISSLTNGTYTVTVTDSKNCTANKSIAISQPSIINIAVDSVNVDCNGNFNGSITITASGGTPTYSYLWNNGRTVSSLTSLAGGTYKVTVTDKNSCRATKTVNIEEPTKLSVISIIKNVACYGNATGKVNLKVSGGVIPYTYSWNTGQTIDSLNNVVAGTYHYTVTDKNLCTVNSSVTITQPAATLTTSTSKNNVSCFGGNDGSINLNVSGGVLAYSYLWSNAAVTKNLSGLIAGNYSVTVTDANLCTTTNAVTITEPIKLSSTIVATNVSCFGESSGAADLTVTGGTSPYTYTWSNGQVGLDDLSGVVAGKYVVTVVDAKSCQLKDSVTLTQPLAALQNVISATNVSCYGNNNGTAKVLTSGGTTPYSYLWNYGQTTDSISNLLAGSYTVTVTDSLSCTKISSINVTQPTELSASIVVTAVSCSGGTNGAANLTILGGTSPYSYLWSNGALTEDISNVSAGNYQVTITDAKLCTIVAYTTVTQPAVLSATISPTNVSCYGGATGIADLTVTGGTPSYSYLWNFGQTIQDISGLAAGNYSVTVNDSKNCVAIASVNISEPLAPLSITYTSNDVKCYSGNTGSINITVSGGTIGTGYKYLWNYGQTTEDLTNISAGTYSVTVTDSKFCTENLSVVISQPTVISGNIVDTKVKCFGGNTGELDLTASGGISPYTYKWSNLSTNEDISNLVVGSYTVTVTDANSCTKTFTKSVSGPIAALTANIVASDVKCFNESTGGANLTVSGGTAAYSYLWSNGYTGEDLSNITDGSYDVTVTDANACTTTKSVVIGEPTPLVLIPSQTNATCGIADGTATVSASGGTLGTGYKYLWSNAKTTSTIIGISSGIYSVTVTDANSCMESVSVAVNDEGAPIASISAIQNVSCNGKNDGYATVTATGGVGTYVYNWSTGDNTITANNLSGGIYYASVTDDNNCLSIATATIQEPDVLLGSILPTNVKCKGNSTGSANLTVSGGTIPYSFIWSSGQNTEDISAISAGFYSVTIVDNNSCQTSNSIVISEPAQVLSASATKVDAKCSGSKSGSVDLTVTGGTPAYSYVWNYGQTSPDLTNLYSGTYEVTVTDANSCKTNASVIVSEPIVLSSSVVITNATCNGINNGAANLLVSGGVSPYSYLWSDGSNSEDLTNVLAGNYTVTITDVNSCQKVESAIISEPTGLSYTISGVNVKCFGENTGSVDLQLTGGSLPYSYLWSSGHTSEDLSNIPAGNYSVTISDSKICSAVASITISQPASVLSSTILGTNLTCYDSKNGNIDLNVSGGTAPYSYSWNFGQTSQDLNNISAGNYQVTISDANSCVSLNTIVITEPNEIILTPTQTSSNCGNSDGTAQISVSGGTSPYTYLWTNGSTNSTISNLTAGIYSVTVTDSKSCVKQNTINISDNSAPTISSPPTIQNVSCYGANDGSIDLLVTSGTPPYTFVWSNTYASEDISNLSGGVYSVTITDALTCKAYVTVTIAEPSELLLSSVIKNVDCKNNANGEVDLTVTGGTFPYSYLWSNADTISDILGLNGAIYQVTVTDKNGCVKTLSNTVTEPLAVLSSTITANNVSCYGLSDGNINLAVSGGTPNYTFVWNNGTKTEDLSNIKSGKYEVTITDKNGCIDTNSITITQPNALSLTDSLMNVDCKYGNDGLAKVFVSGGTQPYIYFWSNGNTTDLNQNLKSGNYLITVTDNNLCKLNSSFTISEPLKELSANYQKTNVNCFGDSTGLINVSVSGGTPIYTYLWNNGSTTEDISNLWAGSYSLTITDANNCSYSLNNISITQPNQALQLTEVSNNVKCFGDYSGNINITVSGGTSPYSYLWNSGQINQDLSNIPSGDYSVTVTDSKSCRVSQDISISQSTKILASIVKSNVSCYGFSDGSATLSVSGGLIPYDFSWNYGQHTQNISSVSSGFYTVSVVDANSCLSVVSTVITEPQPMQLTSSKIDVSCKNGDDGFININVTGGTPNYTYAWNNGETIEDLSNIKAGNYIVTVYDKNSCQKSLNIALNEPLLALESSIVGKNVSCNGLKDGSANLSVTGGTGNYTYNWNYGNNTQDISDLLAGLYEVTVTDENNCSDTASVEITQPNPIVILPSKTNSTCGVNNGTASVSVSGGTLPYSYLWSTGETISSISAKASGTYSVTVSDANTCSKFILININDLNGPVSQISNYTEPKCNASSDGSATVSAIGGTGDYTYHWSNNISLATATNLLAGVYSVTVSDENNCKSSSSVILEEPDAISLSFETINASCHGSSDASINLIVEGGTPNYSYQWNNGKTTQDLSGIKAGNYEVTVSDKNSCSKEGNVTVGEPAQNIIITEISHTNVSCFSYADGAINVSVTGGTSPYTYLWNNGESSQDLTNIAKGTYELTVTDSKSCTGLFSVNVIQPTEIIANAVVTDISCNGNNDGKIDVSVSGGTAPISYLWNNGSTIKDLSALSENEYKLTLTDNNSCTKTLSAIVSEPDVLSLNINHNDVSCKGGNDGKTDLIVNGGTKPYQYLWSENSQTIEDISNLTAGNYTVTVIDKNNCTENSNVTIYEPNDSLAIAYTKINASCFDSYDGSIDISVSGGTQSYSYLWNYGQTSQDIFDLNAKNYELTVTDAKACTKSVSIQISQPTKISIIPIPTKSFCNLNTGMATAIVSGGTGLYAYLWSTGETNDSIFDISSGAYSLTITDENACEMSKTVNVNDIGSPDLSLTYNDVTCFGDADGKISLFTSGGGTPPFDFNWNNGETTQNLVDLSGGNYAVTVTDPNNCKAFIDQYIFEPEKLESQISATDATCNGFNDGMVYLSVTGGTGAGSYTYQWNNGETSEDLDNVPADLYVVAIQDANNCTINNSISVTEPQNPISISVVQNDVTCYNYTDASINITVDGGTKPYSYIWNYGQTSEDILNLSKGVYEVTVTDVNNCNLSKIITITQPDAISISSTQTNVNCKGDNTGKIDLTVTGGTITSDYSYFWNQGETTADIENISAGIYDITISDDNGCEAKRSFSILEPASSLVTQISGTHVSCNGLTDGTISIEAFGGTPNYSILWSNGKTNDIISNLKADVYSVTVTDNQICKSIKQFTVTEPAVLQLFATSDSVICNGNNDGSINLSVFGGTKPYMYEWSNGNITQDLNSIYKGIYAVTVTDANECKHDTIFDIKEPSKIVSSETHIDVSCNGLSDGSVDLSVMGGISPYNYAWNYGQNTQDLSNITAGNYVVTISDKNLCYNFLSINVSQPDQLQIEANIKAITCFGDTDGQIDIVVTGGTKDYVYAWSNGNETNQITNIASGDYTISIVDDKGCKMDSIFTIVEPTPVNISVVSSVNASFDGTCNGYLQLSTSGGTPNYTYNWTTGLTGSTQTKLCEGLYIITAIDANGCEDTIHYFVQKFPPDAIALFEIPNSKGCPPHTPTFVNTSQYAVSYLWDFGDGTTSTDSIPTHTFQNTGLYIVTLTVTGANGKTSSFPQGVTVYQEPNAYFVTNPSVIETFDEPLYTTNYSSNDGATTYLWDFGDGTTSNEREPIHTYMEEGFYDISLIVYSQNMCPDTSVKINAVQVSLNCEVNFPDAFIPDKGGSNGGDWSNEDNFTSNRIFHPNIQKVNSYHLEIFTRWGELIFTSDDVMIGWDGYYNGKLCQQDVYVYKAKYTCEGQNEPQSPKFGNITLYH